MALDSGDWADLATVYRAGAKSARTWSTSTGMHLQAEVLDAQAARCETLAAQHLEAEAGKVPARRLPHAGGPS